MAGGGRVGAFFQELFSVGLYKRSQGRVARQATFAALAVLVGLGAWCLNQYYQQSDSQIIKYLVPLVMLLTGLWASFRIVQMPTFADFLISVEGEMSKVSWPSRGELFRASAVVILVIFILAAVLYLFDVMWEFLLGWLFR
jgi:preprotein translocase subunit SecE